MAAYTPEEITEIFEAWADAVKSGTPVSEELAKQMSDATKAARGYVRAQEEFGKTLGRGVGQLAGSLYKGEKGVGQFGDAVETAATALQMLILAIPGIGLAAKAAAVAIGALGKGMNAAAKQGDALFKSYQDLSRAGATASDGITGVFRNMQNLGYGIEELDKMVQLVTQNSETLAKFSLTAADGTNAFAEGMARIQRDGQLRDLGKTTDDINSAGASFIKQQVLMGRRQSDMQGDLGARTRAYIIELDRLQRLTGTSADVIQKQQEELMSEDAYNVYMSRLEEQGAAGIEQANKIKAVLAAFPQYQKEISQAIGGNVEAQGKLMFLMPGLIRDLRDPAKSYADTMKEARVGLKNYQGAFEDGYLYAADAFRDVGGGVADYKKALASTADIDAREKAAKENATVLDGNTKRLSEAQIANMNSRDAMQAFIQQGVAPATVALNAMAKAASGVTGLGAKAVGAPTGGAAAGSAPGMGKMDYNKELYGTGTGGGGAGAATPGKGLTGKPLSGVSPALAQALQMAAAEYNQLTGRSVEVTSAVRDSAKQAQLYQDYIAGKSAFPAAPPGTSKHERGLAVDVSRAVADELDRMGLLKKYGLSRPVANDPVHIEASAEMGGILSGPKSGFQAMLHGTEAVVPLPDGKKIPVEIPGFSTNFADQTSLMSQQLSKLDELVRVMQNQVSVSTKILQAAN